MLFPRLSLNSLTQDVVPCRGVAAFGVCLRVGCRAPDSTAPSPPSHAPQAFKLFDTNNNGSINLDDLKRVAKELGESMSDEELREMIDEADRNGEGKVSEQDLIRIMRKTSLF